MTNETKIQVLTAMHGAGEWFKHNEEYDCCEKLWGQHVPDGFTDHPDPDSDSGEIEMLEWLQGAGVMIKHYTHESSKDDLSTALFVRAKNKHKDTFTLTFCSDATRSERRDALAQAVLAVVEVSTSNSQR
jgi:hypothetical protein